MDRTPGKRTPGKSPKNGSAQKKRRLSVANHQLQDQPPPFTLEMEADDEDVEIEKDVIAEVRSSTTGHDTLKLPHSA